MNAPGPPPAAAALPDLALAAVALAAEDAPPAATALGADGLLLCLAALRAAPLAGDARLVRVARALALTDAELMTAALVLAAETDPEAARAVAEAQAPLGASRPLLGLCARAFAALDGGTVAALAGGEATRAGLLTLGEETAALPERSLSMPRAIVSALVGGEAAPEGARPVRPADFPLPRALLEKVGARGRALAGAPGQGLVLRVPHRAEGLRLAAEALAAAGLEAVESDTPPAPELGPWLVARNAAPVFRPALGPGDRWRPPDLPGHDGPWIALVGPDGGVEADPPAEDWTPAPPDAATRASLWRAAGFHAEDAVRAAGGLRQGPGRIAEIAALARAAAARRGADRPVWADLRAAAARGAPELEALARRAPAEVPDDALVLPAALRGRMDALLARARVRDRLHEALGPAAAARARRGLAALFAGEPGSGKTLAAHWFAGRLGLPLHRVDLAALTSKWIGETEKNLGALFAAAEHADAVLLFDEADALFASRTDVSDAHDRHANAQTNYLLQRIESFGGVAILASNARDRFDPAFLRRLDAVLDFPLPEAPARALLWRAHLGEGAVVSAAELDRLALAADFAGGHIRNVVFAAAAAALAEDRAIDAEDLWLALDEEHEKLGRAVPARP